VQLWNEVERWEGHVERDVRNICVKFCSETRSTERIRRPRCKWKNVNIPSFKPNRKVANAFF